MKFDWDKGVCLPTFVFLLADSVQLWSGHRAEEGAIQIFCGRWRWHDGGYVQDGLC